MQRLHSLRVAFGRDGMDAGARVSLRVRAHGTIKFE